MAKHSSAEMQRSLSETISTSAVLATVASMVTH